MENHRKTFYTPFILLFATFILLVTAGGLYFYQGYAQINTQAHGTLLKPPVPMQPFNMFAATDKKWQLAYLPAVCCNSACGKELLQLAQLKQSLGQKGQQLEIKLVAKQACEVHDLHHIDMEAINLQQAKQFQETLTPPGELSFDITDKIYLVDPRHNLLLVYTSSANHNDIFKDVKHLLEVSQRG